MGLRKGVYDKPYLAGTTDPENRPMNGNPLDRDSIGALIQSSPPLIDHYLSLPDQLQPNGFDVTLREVARLASPGGMGAGSGQRDLSEVEALAFGPGDWLQLDPGPYLVTFNEVVHLPLDIMALGRTRSSLLRSGVSIHTAVWDSGYQGRSQALLVVHHPMSYRVQRGAKLMQLIFFRLDGPVSQGYQGRFQGENL